MGRHTDRHCMRCRVGWGGDVPWFGSAFEWGRRRGQDGMASKGVGGLVGLISVRWWTAIWIEVGSCPTGTLSAGLLSWNSYGLPPPLGSDRQHLALWEETHKEEAVKSIGRSSQMKYKLSQFYLLEPWVETASPPHALPACCRHPTSLALQLPEYKHSMMSPDWVQSEFCTENVLIRLAVHPPVIPGR